MHYPVLSYIPVHPSCRYCPTHVPSAVQLTDIVPFLLEDELIKRGGDYQKVADWNAFAIQDGLLISGQNPASSELAAHKLLAALAAV